MIRRYCDRCGAENIKETHTNVLYNIVSHFVTVPKEGAKMKLKLVFEGASGFDDEVELCESAKRSFRRGSTRRSRNEE